MKYQFLEHAVWVTECAGSMKAAVFTQEIMERMGVRENEIDAPQVIENFRRVETIAGSAREFRRKLVKQVNASKQSTELARNVSEVLSQAASNSPDDFNRKMFQQVSDFQTIVNDMLESVHAVLTREVCEPLERFEKNEIKAAMGAKKKYDKVRINYETSVVALRNVGKKQKMSYSKIEEAELRKDTFEEAFMSVSEDTTAVLSSVIERHNFIMLDALCYYVEAYSSFFTNACVSLQDMKEALTTARQTVVERRKRYDEEQASQALQNQRNFMNKGARCMFGINLVKYANEKGGVPPPILEAIDSVRTHGLTTEGIFRVSPSKTMLEDTISLIEQKKPVDWAELPPHVPCSVIKEFLREMQDPLFTKELYDQWVELDTYDDPESEGQRIEELTMLLPESHRVLFLNLMELCVEVTDHTEDNKMGAKQLAIVLAPNVLYQDLNITDPAVIVAVLASSNEAVFRCINYFNSHRDRLSRLVSSTPVKPWTRCTTHQDSPPRSPRSPLPSRGAAISHEQVIRQIEGLRKVAPDHEETLKPRQAVSSLKPPQASKERIVRNKLPEPGARTLRTVVPGKAGKEQNNAAALRNTMMAPQLQLNISVEEDVEINVSHDDLDRLLEEGQVSSPSTSSSSLPDLLRTPPPSRAKGHEPARGRLNQTLPLEHAQTMRNPQGWIRGVPRRGGSEEEGD